MRLAVLKERRAGETRVAATPETAKKLIALGCTVAIEAGAGLAAGFIDQAYADAGAEICQDAATTLFGAGVVLKVRAPLAAGEGEVDELSLIHRGALLIGTLEAGANPGRAEAYAAAGLEACAMELAAPHAPARRAWTCSRARPTWPAIALSSRGRAPMTVASRC